jgi:hypothetical protein
LNEHWRRTCPSYDHRPAIGRLTNSTWDCGSPVQGVLLAKARDLTKLLLSQVNGFLVPPPLAEQPRIVAKVNELMALRLEARLASADNTRRRLLEALLAEAFAPDDERELKGAE